MCQCRTGNYNQCPQRLGFGVLINGADAPLVAVRQGILHHVPANVDLAEAALTEPLCVAFNALAVKSRIRPGDVVLVLGPGPIGLMATQVARVGGASAIILAGRDRATPGAWRSGVRWAPPTPPRPAGRRAALVAT